MENKKNNVHLLTQVIDYIDELIYWKDTQGHYLGCNRAYLEKLCLEGQMSPEITSIIGLSDYDLFPKAIADNYQTHDTQVIQSGQPIQVYECSYSNPAIDYHLLSYKYPLFDEDNNICGVIGRSYDFSSLTVDDIKVRLTYRELQVYATLYAGMTAKEAASFLMISEKTIENYIALLKTKLNFGKRSQLVQFALYKNLGIPFKKILADLGHIPTF